MLSKGRNESIIDERRTQVALLVFVAVVFGFIGRLWYLQVLKGREFSVASERNRVREVTRPAPRGFIYDRDGSLILANRPFFDLVVIPQYLTDREKTLKIVSNLFHIPPEQIEKRLQEASTLPHFVPVRIKKNLTLHEVAMVESNKFFMPGIEVDTAPRRDYARSDSAHLLGYLGEVTQKGIDILNSQSKDYQYRLGATTGMLGVERKFEQYLRGAEGKEYLQVDAYGRLRSTSISELNLYQSKLAKRGYDLYLTIDQEVQRAAVDAFRQKNGAVVALDPRTGEVLAYVSNPNFDLSIYQEGLSGEDWQSLQSNPFKPLLDKVTGGAYPPGSTFKIIMAIAGLEEGVVTPDKTWHCGGSFSLGNATWRCHDKKGHGIVNMRRSLEVSCDVYYYQLGNILGADRIAKWSKLFGLGEKTDLNLNMEVSGIVPSPDWKLRVKNQPWTAGDTINVSIGQGFNLTTPIQIAAAYAALGNDGKLFRPFLLKKVMDETGRVIDEEKPLLRRKLPIRPENLKVVQMGSLDVVETGTGKRAKVKGFTVAGKSGTAQTAALHAANKMDELAFQQRDHAWFAAYSPAENPEIAVVAISEYDGGHGGSEAGPIAQKVIEAYWRKRFPEKFPNANTEPIAIKKEVSLERSRPDVSPSETIDEREDSPSLESVEQ